MRCGNAGECLHQQLQVSRIDVKCLRLLTVTLVEKCYKIQRTDWKPVLHRVCAGKKGLNSALQPLVHRSCSCGGQQNLQWLVPKCLPRLLVPGAAVTAQDGAVCRTLGQQSHLHPFSLLLQAV